MSISAGFMGCIWPEPSRHPRQIEHGRPSPLSRARPDRATGVICDQTIALDGHYTSRSYPEHLRRIRFRDSETAKTLVFLTNHCTLPALTIAALYKNRWHVELFFKWIKQHLRTQTILRNLGKRGEDPNLDRRLVYCPRRHHQKRLGLDASLYTLLQVLSVSLFEKIELKQALRREPQQNTRILRK